MNIELPGTRMEVVKREPESLDQEALDESTTIFTAHPHQPETFPDYQPADEDRLLNLFLQYEKGIPVYDRYIDEDSGGNYPVHASVRLSPDVFEHIEDSGEAVSQWIREACEARYREEKGN